jgi:hypothetical protein
LALKLSHVSYSSSTLEDSFETVSPVALVRVNKVSILINPTFYGIVDSPRENVDNLIRGFVREDLKVSKNAIFLSSSTSK